MITVYVHPSALLLAAGDPAPPGSPEPPSPGPVDPGAAEALGHLAEAGMNVAVVAASDIMLPVVLAPLPRVAELPDPLEAGTWFLTGEPNPIGGPPRGGTTILVGPRPPDGPVPLPRFDVIARDLSAAAMEILTRQAMA